MDCAAHALTSGATGGSKRAECTHPSSRSCTYKVVLTTTVTSSACSRSAMHARTAAATIDWALGSGGVFPNEGPTGRGSTRTAGVEDGIGAVSRVSALDRAVGDGGTTAAI